MQGKDGKEFSLSIFANLCDYYSLTVVFDIHSEAQFSMNNRDQWAELGIAKISMPEFSSGNVTFFQQPKLPQVRTSDPTVQ